MWQQEMEIKKAISHCKVGGPLFFILLEVSVQGVRGYGSIQAIRMLQTLCSRTGSNVSFFRFYHTPILTASSITEQNSWKLDTVQLSHLFSSTIGWTLRRTTYLKQQNSSFCVEQPLYRLQITPNVTRPTLLHVWKTKYEDVKTYSLPDFGILNPAGFSLNVRLPQHTSVEPSHSWSPVKWQPCW